MISLESVIASLVLIGALVISVKKVPRKGGHNIIHHVVFGGVAIVITLGLPYSSRQVVFSPLTTSIVGNVFPLMQSIRAVLTPETTDDKVWLQYWIATGIVTLTFESFEDFTMEQKKTLVTFYTIQFFYYSWLLSPFTNGAGLIHKYVTIPLLTPLVQPIRRRCQGLFSFLASLTVTAVHVYALVIFFVLLPTPIKRFSAIAIGTVYPTIASIGAAATPEPDDDTFWLTYWSCYALLFLTVDFLETYLGGIPGFYAAFIVGIIYLMLPTINGAEKIFRDILVPFAGQQKMLVYRDAIQVKKSLHTQVKEQHQQDLSSMIDKVFATPWEEMKRHNYEFVDPDLLEESTDTDTGSEPLISDDESGMRQRRTST